MHDHPHFMWKLSGLTLLLTLQIATTNVRMVMVIHGANRPPPTIQPRSNQRNSPSSLSHRVVTTTEQNNLPFPSIMQPEQTSQQLERLSHPSLHYEPAVNKITLAEPATIEPIHSRSAITAADQSSSLSITNTNPIQKFQEIDVNCFI